MSELVSLVAIQKEKIEKLTEANQLLEDEIYRLKKEIVAQADYIVELSAVLQEIKEKCKRTMAINKGSDNEFTLGKITFAEFILKDLSIQEVE